MITRYSLVAALLIVMIIAGYAEVCLKLSRDAFIYYGSLLIRWLKWGLS